MSYSSDPSRRRRWPLAIVAALILGAAPVLGVAGAVYTAVAAATATLAVNPIAATPATTVTLVGAGYNASTPSFTPTVTFAFTDANGLRINLPQTATTSSNGTFGAQVAVPRNAATGPAVFSATDVSGTVGTASFDVRPVATSIGVSPTNGLPGSTTVITGAGFAVNQPITLTYTQGSYSTVFNVSGLTTTSSGLFTTTVPISGGLPAGQGLFTAQDRDNNSATTPFTVTRFGVPTVAVSPTVAAPSASVVVTGSGFAVSQPISITFGQNSTASGVVSGTVSTDAKGVFTATVAVPSTAIAGTSALTATDASGNTGATALRIDRPVIGVSPLPAAPGSTVAITGAGFAPSVPISITFGQNGATTGVISGTIATNANGAFTTTALVPASAVTGTAAFTAVDAAGVSATAPLTIQIPYNTNNGPTTLYFAEGYTGQFANNGKASYNETLSILNANPFTATATITYLIQGGAPAVFTRSVPASSTLRESVNADIGADKTAAAVVSSPSRLTAQRTIQRIGGSGAVLDGNSSLGNPNLGKTFYFAEGYTGISFQEYLTLANPGTTDAHITVVFAPQAGVLTSTLSEVLTIPAQGRLTRNIRSDTLSFSNKSVGMIVSSDQPIMAERVLYFGQGDGSGKFGSTAKAGIQTVATQYLFAYGSSGGSGPARTPDDQSFVTVLNPGASPVAATVIAQFYDVAGRSLGMASVTVAPGTRQTINVNAVTNNVDGIHSTVLTSASPFVAEQPQYYGGSPNVGAHPGVAPSGAPAGNRSAAFPDLSLVNANGQQTQQTVFLYNPIATPITVTATYYGSTGIKTVDYRVGPNAITTVNVNADASGLTNGPLGATFIVSSTGATDQFVATEIGATADGHSYTGNQGALPAQ